MFAIVHRDIAPCAQYTTATFTTKAKQKAAVTSQA
jgi:hypothetical protein